MDDETKKLLLDNLSLEDITFLTTAKINSQKEEQNNPPATDGSDGLTPAQTYYANRKIAGSTKRCTSCGQDLVNDVDHAIALLGDDEDLLQYLGTLKAITTEEVKKK